MKYLIFVPAFFIASVSYAQPSFLFKKDKDKEEKYAGPQWDQTNKASVYLSQVSFVNWNAGGTNSISGLFAFETKANYSDKYFSWNNNALVRLGINKQQSKDLQKSDDLVEINSNLGYQPDVTSNWFYSARMNFKSQMFNGYKYPNTDEPISRLLAPGYLFFGGGMEYGKHIDKLSFYFSPLTLKATFVLDEDLSNSGAFGVEPAVYDDSGNLLTPGERVRKELGVLVTNTYETEVVTNINLKNQVSLYSDYVNNFGNVDIDWSVDFDFKVNNYIKATLGSHIRYDDDVKTKVPSTEVEGEFDEAGAKVQWKQFLGIGVAVDF
ncbi:hypothetical protein PK35_02175 [Tamlana nanhaiensis]|uniref:DUF3078 domain-containing protein n=1 Tax=Neotamlana nanhaiensis TaxID=1382798 RepID=A0A0D7W6E6_9FLAO|nr:DUF3078 domain-containing protein [Tamlana nanhaiensis]KJD34609.1 hypothetical protein PK35_02175 [Tamlana nanhaiensis]